MYVPCTSSVEAGSYHPQLTWQRIRSYSVLLFHHNEYRSPYDFGIRSISAHSTETTIWRCSGWSGRLRLRLYYTFLKTKVSLTGRSRPDHHLSVHNLYYVGPVNRPFYWRFRHNVLERRHGWNWTKIFFLVTLRTLNFCWLLINPKPIHALW